MTSSVDPTLEIEAILTRLRALGAEVFEGVDQETVLPQDGYGDKAPYRDLQPGSMTQATTQRILGVGEQSQPQIWSFQVAHVAPTRKQATDLAVETDVSLIGWAPTVNASPITTFFFTVYDEFDRDGATLQWIATRFYRTTLGQNPDLS